jgi:fructokinase
MLSCKAVCFGEILWDVLPSGAKPGGAPMNVAYHLQKLGIETTLISRVGKDKSGDDLLSILKQQSLRVDYIQTDAIHKTGIVNAQLYENNEVEFEIVFPVAWDFIAYEK